MTELSRKWIISDLQVPYHDKRAVEAVAQCIADHKTDADTVCSIGDEMDMQTISRFSAGTPLEYERSIGKDRDTTVQVLHKLQVQHMIRSNHTDRLYNKIMRNAPGLLGTPELELENFLRLPALGITFHKEGWDGIAPGWVALHGDEAGVSQVAGQTAAGLAKKTGKSVVCGHTHRIGVQPYSTSVGGSLTRTLWGFEVGNLMDLKQAKYTKGIANWQQGFGVIYVQGKTVVPVPIPIVNRSFVFEGEQYSW
jgi:hypothetical protein